MAAKGPLLWVALLCSLVFVYGRMQCYDCPKIARAQDCARTTVCGEHEICYSQRYIGSNLQEYYSLGCTDTDVCSQNAFSLFGDSILTIGKKREETLSHAHAHTRRQTSTDMVLCLQCCSSELCNIDLCGASKTSTHLKRCFECTDIKKPHDCDRVVECGNSYQCYANYAPQHVTHDHYVYKMGCMPDLQCNVLELIPHDGCSKCCKDNYCNFVICDANATVTNTSSQSSTQSATTTVTTPTAKTTPSTTPTTTTEKPPTLVISPANQIMMQYTGTVTATCSSDQNVNVKWDFVGGSDLPPGVTTDGNGGLKIAHLNESNMGVYKCVGVSPTGKLASTLLTVNISDTPAIVINVQRIPQGPLAPGAKFTLHCNVIGFPTPNITWSYTDKVGLQTVPTNVNYENNDRDLIVNSYVGAHNDGKWTCTARNNFGRSAGHTTIP